MKIIILILGAILMTNAIAKIQMKKVKYKSGDLSFEGFVAFDDAIKKPMPGVVIFHNWLGVTEETESKVRDYANLGVVAFAGDIYGAGIRPKNPKEAGELATKYKTDRKLLRERVNLALSELLKQKNVDKNKVVALGYCFGGTAALELGRSGAELRGVISFHGGLSNPNPSDAKNINGRVFVFHGAIDPFVPKDEFDLFVKEMNEAKINFQVIQYSNTVHSFTDKNSGNDISKGGAYNQYADENSFMITKEFISSL